MSSVTFYGSINPTFICSDPSNATAICNGIAQMSDVEVICGGNIWRTGICFGVCCFGLFFVLKNNNINECDDFPLKVLV